MYVLALKKARFLSPQSTVKTLGFRGRAFHKRGSREAQGALQPHAPVKVMGGLQGQAVTWPRASFPPCLVTLPAKDLTQERTRTAMAHVSV